MSSYDDGVGENRLGVESSSHVHGGNQDEEKSPQQKPKNVIDEEKEQDKQESDEDDADVGIVNA